MNYLDRIADAIQREVAPDKLPNGDALALFRLYAVLVLAKGSDVTLNDVHNAWSAWMIARDPDHESIKPVKDLSVEVQKEDEPYLKAIHRVASRIDCG